MNMLGDWAVMANVKLAATVNIKLTISNQNAVRFERKLARQKSKIFCKSCTYACRCDQFNILILVFGYGNMISVSITRSTPLLTVAFNDIKDAINGAIVPVTNLAH